MNEELNIGKKIRLLREKKGLKQDELADKVGISRPYLSGIEGDKRNPTYTIVREIANELDVGIEELEKVDSNE